MFFHRDDEQSAFAGAPSFAAVAKGGLQSPAANAHLAFPASSYCTDTKKMERPECRFGSTNTPSCFPSMMFSSYTYLLHSSSVGGVDGLRWPGNFAARRSSSVRDGAFKAQGRVGFLAIGIH